MHSSDKYNDPNQKAAMGLYTSDRKPDEAVMPLYKSCVLYIIIGKYIVGLSHCVWVPLQHLFSFFQNACIEKDKSLIAIAFVHINISLYDIVCSHS